MNLESLANELLLDLFEYLTAVHLLRAFHGLNVRFDKLLFIQLRTTGLDCRSVSQTDFNIICRHHLPTIVDQITGLRLADDDDTPQQTGLFLAHGLTLRQFTHLQSLSLCDLCSEETIYKIMLELHHLPNFTHLTLAGCYFPYYPIEAQCIVNSIWSLPKLICCYLNFRFQEVIFPKPTVISLSMKQLSIWGSEHRWNDMVDLFEHTPGIQDLCFLLNYDSNDENIRYTAPSITKLNISVVHAPESMIINVLQNMPNLHQLTVDMCCNDTIGSNTILDGHRWETIIRDHLPQLQMFRLKMICQFSHNEQQVNNLIDSFRSRFWIEEYRWFVQCHWNPESSDSPIYLYTLPYAFNDFNMDWSIQSKSTYPREYDPCCAYNSVRSLTCETFSPGGPIPSDIRLLNIHNLSLTLPIKDQFWSIVQKIDQLTVLDVTLNDDNDARSQLQILLDRTPRLYSLNFGWWPPSSSQMPPFEITSVSVRRLSLRGCDRCFSGEQCATLSRSPLGLQCEVILIKVENRKNILDLVSSMNNLRALNVQCADDKWSEQLSATEDELIEWLQYHLPSTCTTSRDQLFDSDIRIWIR